MRSIRHVSLLATATILAATAAAALDVSAPSYDHEWPQWRGPRGTGVAPHGDPPVTWSESENVRWKVAVPGRGHASPIVWEDRVFVLTAVEVEPESAGDAVAETAPEAFEPIPEGGTRFRPRGIHPDNPVRFVVLAFDRATGELVWERTARTAVPHEGTHRTATWASASAVTDGEILVASFGSNGLYAYDLDGKLLWERDSCA